MRPIEVRIPRFGRSGAKTAGLDWPFRCFYNEILRQTRRSSVSMGSRLHRNPFRCQCASQNCTETRFSATGGIRTAPKPAESPPVAVVWAFLRHRATRYSLAPTPVVRPRPLRPAHVVRITRTPRPGGCSRPHPSRFGGRSPRPAPARPRPAPVVPARSDFFDFPQICPMRPREAVFFWIKEGRQGDLRQRNAIDAGRPANVQR